jgi:hypothetical protein
MVGELPGELWLVGSDVEEREREVAKLQGRGERDDQECAKQDTQDEAQA